MIDERSQDGTGWARFSDDRLFRYRLARALTPAGLGALDQLIAGSEFTADGRLVTRIKRVTFLLLNPSDATAFKPDPTVSRCVKFAQLWGGDILEVVNLFAFRSPWPEEVWLALDRGDGPENDAAIVAACTGATRVIAGWGVNGWRYGRGDTVRARLREAGVKLEALAFSAGQPRHPHARGKHRIPDDVEPMAWET